MLLFPRLTQLDLTGPLEVFHRIPDTQVHVLWKDTSPVHADGAQIGILPTATLSASPRLDVLFVPGGFGHVPLLTDDEVLSFLADQGKSARYVTSVCTGALLLGAAGLLEGYEATTHWAYMELLDAFGARPVRRRVVIDRNRITGGGVTAGLDFALRVVAELAGEPTAKAIQLRLEYDPEPPFRSGHPDVADPETVERERQRLAGRIAEDRAQIERWKLRRQEGGEVQD
jgi:cyclohexyl-isocyanide hydratase